MKDIKGWIFVSHSTRDLDRVRRVRDYLEAKNHEPLLFFLRCIRDTDELDSLIRREIEARSIFLLCDSPHARASNWVRREVELIRALPDRHCEFIDLLEPWEKQREALDRLSRHSTVFLSFSVADRAEVTKISEELQRRDYRIFVDRTSLEAGQDGAQNIAEAIDAAVENGFFLFFASKAAVTARWVLAELRRGLAKSAGIGFERNNFLVVWVGDKAETVALPADAESLAAVDVRGMQPPEQAGLIHRSLCRLT